MVGVDEDPLAAGGTGVEDEGVGGIPQWKVIEGVGEGDVADDDVVDPIAHEEAAVDELGVPVALPHEGGVGADRELDHGALSLRGGRARGLEGTGDLERLLGGGAPVGGIGVPHARLERGHVGVEVEGGILEIREVEVAQAPVRAEVDGAVHLDDLGRGIGARRGGERPRVGDDRVRVERPYELRAIADQVNVSRVRRRTAIGDAAAPRVIAGPAVCHGGRLQIRFVARARPPCRVWRARLGELCFEHARR